MLWSRRTPPGYLLCVARGGAPEITVVATGNRTRDLYFASWRLNRWIDSGLVANSKMQVAGLIPGSDSEKVSCGNLRFYCAWRGEVPRDHCHRYREKRPGSPRHNNFHWRQ